MMQLSREERLLHIGKMTNVRDLGGYETQEGYYTKSHKYVRSTCPSGISDDLKEQFYQYGIRTVIDLRSDYELVHQPHSLKGYKDIEYYHINLLQNENMSVLPNDIKDYQDLSGFYIFMIEANKKQLKKVFNIFSSIFSRIFSRNKEKESVDWAAKINNNKVLQTINDPIYVGLAIGTFLALLGGYNLKGALEVGMYMAALMFILPRMASILMEGLTPISAAAKEFMGKKYKGQQFYIGMDSAIIIGHPTTLAVGLLSIPILLVLALLPGNKLIPMAGLATLAYFGVMATPIHKGKFFRTLVSQTVILTFCMYLGSYFAPLITEHALNAGTAVPEGAGGITSMSANVFEFLTYFLFKLGTIPGACISIAIVAVLIIWNRKYIAGKDNFTTQEFVSAEASDYKK